MPINSSPSLIPGSAIYDERGSITFCNDFDMAQVRRMYLIAPASTKVIRAWQGHRKEEKWFYCLSGAFEIKLIEVDNFDNPTSTSPVQSFLLNQNQPQVLHIPGGFASGIKAVSEDSKLMVYSNFTVDESMQDNFRYTIDTWNVWEK